MSDDESIVNQGRRKFLGDGLKVGTAGLVAAQFPMITFAQEPEIIRPTLQLKSSFVWRLGEEGFIDDSHLDPDDPARVNKNLDKAFFIASTGKAIMHLIKLRLMRDGKLPEDEDLVMSQYALNRSTNSVFTNKFMQDNFVIIDDQRRDTLKVHEAMDFSATFSANDAHIALVERISFGRRLPKDISQSASRKLVGNFIESHINPVLEEFNMGNTFMRTATGLPFNAAEGDPADFENFSIADNMQKFWNGFYAEFPEEMERLYRPAELKVHRVYKNPETNKWEERFKRLANDAPNLEHSTETEDDKAQSIPIPNVDYGKSGLNRYCLWEAFQSYNLENIGGKGRLMIFTSGDANDTYATHPKHVLENALELVRPTIKPEPLFEVPREDGVFGPIEEFPQV